MTTLTRWNTPAHRIRSVRIGEHTLTYLPDGDVQLSPRGWLPESVSEDWTASRCGALLDGEGFLAASIGGLLIEHDGRSMLIDAGFGPRRWGAAQTHPVLGVLQGGSLADSLRRVGKDPSDLELIAFTHLHDDHFGWVFSAPGSPFQEARLVASEREWAWWHASSSVRRRGAAKDGDEIFPGVTAWVTPGHTPGHTSYVISSGSRRLIAFGDVFHSAAQLDRPEWRVSMDMIPDEAVHTRKAVLDELSRTHTLAFGNHFSDVQFGRVPSRSEGLLWESIGSAEDA
ncbi:MULTISPECIES: MBL fold metallo-hydrolase [unclassified Streptomyces]|uniref:MBL fold metallo-hydrolase n=1 Tax=unclassified Streptomyces TaxID=2593676 RepID=UPI00382592E6